MRKKLLIFTLIFVMSFVYFVTSDISNAFAKTTEEERIEKGLYFSDANEVYDSVKALEAMPKTFEAYIHVPKTVTGRAGIIYGSYGPDSTTACFSFEIYSNGYPKLYYDIDNIGTTNPGVVNINFTQVDVRSDGYVHLAIVHDSVNKLAYCYLDGELKQTLSVNEPANYNGFNFVPSKPAKVGGDYRSGNGQYFKGNIKGLECYTDVRTAEEINADSKRLLSSVPTDDNLLCAYNFTQSGKDYLKDLSNNGYDIDYSGDNFENVDAIVYDTESRYITEENYSVHPNTFEAEILLAPSYSSRAGVILGNYGLGASISFEINVSGKPRIFYTDSTGTDQSIIFEADVRTGNWAHLAITHDVFNKKLHCYINGVKVAESNNCLNYSPESLNYPFVVGGDNRSGNEQYFKGFIRSVALYSDVRSNDEIMQDYVSGVDLTDDKLMVSYSMDKSDTGKDISNLASGKYNLHYQTTWFSQKDPVNDYAYSFAVVGDTQILARRYPQEFGKIYDWIVDNKDSKNIQYVFGLGDITDANTPAEWAVAKREVSKLNGVVPYSLVRGNHDSSLWFNNTFFTEEYVNQFDGFYDDASVDNCYNTFVVGDVDYLLFTLDYGASDEELEWAASVIEEHPNHRVIITTHCYLFRDGTTLDQGDVCPPADSNDADYSPNKLYNNGQKMWEKLVSKYGNIFLVLSGHDPCENVVTVQSEGVHGNTVTQILVDPQGMDAAMGATGMVAMLYFSKDGNEIEVEFYSTVHKQFFKESNQYTIDISKTGNVAHNYVNKSDDTHHWLECDCGSVTSHEEHNYQVKFNDEEHYSVCDCGQELEGSRHKHNYDEGKVIVKPTNKTTGEKEFSCLDCDSKYIEVLEKTRGCNGSIGISIISFMILFIGFIVIKRKRDC